MKSQTFGEKIKELRLNLNYTLNYVGDNINYNPKLLSKVEKNQKSAPQHIIKSLSKILEISHKELEIKYLSELIYYKIRQSDFADEVLSVVSSRLKKEKKGTQIEKSKDAILDAIKAYFIDKPVEKVWVFGSFARNAEISKDSDIDLMVVFKKPNRISLFNLIQMKKELSQKTGREIDLVEEGQELKSFKNTIRNERVLVYDS